MKNQDVAALLQRMGTLLELKEENVFKVRAYFKAAENIENLAEDIVTIEAEHRLSEIPGVGKTLEEKISEYLKTGKLNAYDRLIREIPESILEVINIPSVGPKKAKLFFDQLKIKDIEGLRKAAEGGDLLKLPGIKEKTLQNILRGIQVVKEGQERMNLGSATRLAQEFVQALGKLKMIKRIEAAGSLRRCKETVRDIDILVVSTQPQNVMQAFIALPQVSQVNVHGETKSSILTKDHVQVDLRVVEEKCFGAALLYFTGSKSFNIKLRQIAHKKSMKVSEYGIFSTKGNTEKLIAGHTEEECFKAMGLAYVPPELREDLGEAELFRRKTPPALIEQKDIAGDLHVHSTWSDGRNSIAEMAEAARGLGYRYLGVSDHSPRLRIAGGVSPADLVRKKKEIDALNKKYKNFRILFGTEVEIDSNGNLDYNDKILSEFDIVIAAVHSGFDQSRDQLTKRIMAACRHKAVNIIAHPTGVHLGKRAPYDIDFKEICKCAADTGTCLEINAFPIRLDLNSANAYFARQQGVTFAINTDSHATAHLEYMFFGVATARRGWISPKDVLNTLPLAALLKKLGKTH